MQGCVYSGVTLVRRFYFCWNVSVCACALSSRVDGDGCLRDVGTLVQVDVMFVTSVSVGM